MTEARAIAEDWKNREFIESIELAILQMTQFLNRFGQF